ncbi:MAG: four helix bundle protein [Candidatus Sungbacteria bacterium]|uniref:Four helix bundle protein n=1 Tax=Candidatus Sungiibacteriota bacterium TaxID=2750080 RepID=A0A9D6QTQ8_9BACT|nr:four helix bundle protein [Candidatus Sungbacteria bacterium]
MNSYRELLVWQKSIELTTETYRMTELYPKSEVYGLTSQIRRAAISIASNIAEGWSRKNIKEYNQFLRIARGSAAELETQLLVSKNVGLLNTSNFDRFSQSRTSIMKMLNALITSLNRL